LYHLINTKVRAIGQMIATAAGVLANQMLTHHTPLSLFLRFMFHQPATIANKVIPMVNDIESRPTSKSIPMTDCLKHEKTRSTLPTGLRTLRIVNTQQQSNVQMYCTFHQATIVLCVQMDRLCSMNGKSDEDKAFFSAMWDVLQGVGIPTTSCFDILQVLMLTLFTQHQSHADLLDPIFNPVAPWYLSWFSRETERFVDTLHGQMFPCATRDVIVAFLQSCT
jgi:hypothetical protein